MKLIVAILTTVVSVTSFAAVDQRFTFELGRTEYAKASVPREADLGGSWLQVAYAFPDFSSYAADGDLPDSDGVRDGVTSTFVITTTDLFGHPAVQAEEVQRSSKSVSSGGFFEGIDSSDAFVLKFPRSPDQAHYNCRLTAKPEYLICELFYEWNNKWAQQSFELYVRQP